MRRPWLAGCRFMGAAGVAAGVVAQYLQHNPNATIPDVRRALTGGQMSTRNLITEGSIPNYLLYTNLTSPPPEGVDAVESGGGGGLAVGAIVGIVAAVAVGEKSLQGSPYLGFACLPA